MVHSTYTNNVWNSLDHDKYIHKATFLLLMKDKDYNYDSAFLWCNVNTVALFRWQIWVQFPAEIVSKSFFFSYTLTGTHSHTHTHTNTHTHTHTHAHAHTHTHTHTLTHSLAKLLQKGILSLSRPSTMHPCYWTTSDDNWKAIHYLHLPMKYTNK